MEPREVEDLFLAPEGRSAPAEHIPPPSESVYIDENLPTELLTPVGEIQLPRPVPVELIVEIDGWDYVFKLDRRSRSVK